MMNRRKYSRKFLGILPDKLRLKILRRHVRIHPDWPSPSLEIKIADTAPELESAYRLLHDSYVKAGFMNPDPTGMRVLPQHLLPQTTTIVAKWDGKVIGTLSLIRDNPFGLPMEKTFNLDDRRLHGRRLAEVSSLAIDPRHRGQVNRALFPLFRFVYQYARQCFGIHEFVIAVNPSMVDLYLAFMCFERLKAKPIAYDFVKGAPAVGLYLNFETVLERLIQTFAHRPASTNFHKYWTEIPTDPRNQMPERQYYSASDPILTPQLLVEFFLSQAQLASKMSYKNVQVLLDVYPFPHFRKVLEPLLADLTRKHLRMETHMKAEIGPDRTPAEVLNVSRDGLLLRVPSRTWVAGQTAEIDVWVSALSSARLKVEVRRCHHNSLYGLRILEPPQEWLRMVETLEREYIKVAEPLQAAA